MMADSVDCAKSRAEPIEPDLVWNYGKLRVYYRPELDGAGSRITRSFIDFMARRKNRYSRALEWCAGPGFIGFALLEEGYCEELRLIDINPEAIRCVNRTITENGLTGRVKAYAGDNLTPLPSNEKFDLVVSNPPNFFALNPRHSRYELYKDDRRPNDPGWHVHQGFYSDVHQFLNPGAVLHISEVEPEKSRVFIPREESEPYDVRPRPAHDDFVPMIQGGGLRYSDTELFFTGPDGAELSIMTSVNDGPPSLGHGAE